MGRRHPSTPAQQAQWASQMLVHAHEYGFVTQLSRTLGVSRPTLYAFKKTAQQALAHAFGHRAPASTAPASVERQILTLLVEGHNSYANIQTCLYALCGQHVSIGTIAAVVQDAQTRALDWMATHAPSSSRTLALDEIYATNRCGAYLNVVDCESWAVWAAEGPLRVDSESWTLLLWLAQERGLSWHATVSDGGDALRSACQSVDPTGCHRRDVWHLWHFWNQIQRRVSRRLTTLQAQTATVERQAARIAAGQKARGGRPRSDLSAHQTEISQVERTDAELRALGQELQRVLAVVVLDRAGVVDLARRREELAAVLELLAEVAEQAPGGLQADLRRLHTQLRLAQQAVVAFAAPLDQIQRDLVVVIGQEGVALLGWAWQRRAILGPDVEQVVAGLPEAWRQAARVLFHAWERAGRASSAVENWHSILRPHLAVHRVLSSGLLALLAVWHNHRVFKRGVHKGKSPLQLSGMTDTPTDWLVALGYAAAPSPATPKVLELEEFALAA